MAAEKPGAAGPTVFVRHGGTTSSREDRKNQIWRRDVAQRRTASDRKDAVIRASARGDPQAGLAREFSHQLLSHRANLSVVLNLVSRDGEVYEQEVCELKLVDTLDQTGKELSLTLVCPKCVFNYNRPQHESQLEIRMSNRRFSFDPNSELSDQIWVNPHDTNEVLTQAGTIELDDWVRCGAVGCGFRFKIGPYKGKPNCVVADWL